MFPHARRVRRFLNLVLALTMVVVAMQPVGSTRAAAPRPNEWGQGQLYVLGDSLTLGSVAFGSLRNRLASLDWWTDVSINHKVGRTAGAGAAVLAARLARKPRPTAIVVALGTNDMIIHDERPYPRAVINKVMSKARGIPVLWVNVEFSRSAQPNWHRNSVRFNAALQTATQRWPNLIVADWNRYFVPAKGLSTSLSRFVADGVHMTPRAYRRRAAWLTSQVDDFGRTIIDATTTTTTSTSTTTTTTTTTSIAPPP